MKMKRKLYRCTFVILFVLVVLSVGMTLSYGKTNMEKPRVTIENRASDGKPRLEWEPVEDAERYEIYRSNRRNGTYKKLFTTKGTVFINTSAQPGETFFYKVRAVDVKNDYETSVYSTVVYRTCDLPKPKITIQNRIVDGKPVVKWSQIEAADQYVVYRSLSKTGIYKKIFTTSGSSFINTSAKAGTRYYYRVKAVLNATTAATSAQSNYVYSTCNLGQPQVKIARRLSDAKPSLTWKKVKGADKYEIYRALSEKGTYQKFYTTYGTKFTNTSTEAGTKYYYKVKAVSNLTREADSAYSQIKSCTCGAPYIVSSTDNKYTYSDFKTDMNQLIEKYPDILSKKYLGKTVDHRGLYYIVLGNPNAEKQIFVTAGFHAREYINCQLTMRMIEHYCRGYDSSTYKGVKYRDLFEDVSFCIMPMVNPDGIAISALGPDAISNDTVRAKVKKMPKERGYYFWKSNARGVDLNRNYKMYSTWPEEKTYSSSGYPGPSRYSENETKAVLAAMADCANIEAVMNYHSMGSVVYWGYHNKTYKENCWEFANAISSLTGYGTIDESYTKATFGDYEHYIMHEYKIPYVCIETGRGAVPIHNDEFYHIFYENYLGYAAAAHHFQ